MAAISQLTQIQAAMAASVNLTHITLHKTLTPHQLHLHSDLVADTKG